jgi:hypothetical protein
MGTAISRTATLGLAALAIAAAGCGATTATKSRGPTATTPSAQTPAAGRDAFAWLRPTPAPAHWRSARIATGAVLRFPPGWRRVAGDAGTATAALQNAQHEFLGYLNLTPRQANENLSTWASFRTRHNIREGEHGVKELAAATGLRFSDGHGSCVRDAYTTATGNSFIELACLVQRSRAASVIVGAAPPRMWALISPVIERAISALAT